MNTGAHIAISVVNPTTMRPVSHKGWLVRNAIIPALHDLPSLGRSRTLAQAMGALAPRRYAQTHRRAGTIFLLSIGLLPKPVPTFWSDAVLFEHRIPPKPVPTFGPMPFCSSIGFLPKPVPTFGSDAVLFEHRIPPKTGSHFWVRCSNQRST